MLVYSRIDNRQTYMELWGASTKHPDVRNCLQSDIEDNLFTPSVFVSDEAYTVFQWLVYRLSTLSFHTRYYLSELMEIANDTFGDDYFM